MARGTLWLAPLALGLHKRRVQVVQMYRDHPGAVVGAGVGALLGLAIGALAVVPAWILALKLVDENGAAVPANAPMEIYERAIWRLMNTAAVRAAVKPWYGDKDKWRREIAAAVPANYRELMEAVTLHESSLNPLALAGFGVVGDPDVEEYQPIGYVEDNSSAAGPFQITRQTWNGAAPAGWPHWIAWWPPAAIRVAWQTLVQKGVLTDREKAINSYAGGKHWAAYKAGETSGYWAYIANHGGASA